MRRVRKSPTAVVKLDRPAKEPAPLSVTARWRSGACMSAGISVFWKSPLGPIRIDLAAPILKQSYDKTQVFNFSTSTRF